MYMTEALSNVSTESIFPLHYVADWISFTYDAVCHDPGSCGNLGHTIHASDLGCYNGSPRD